MTPGIPPLLRGYLIAWVSQSLDEEDICIYGDPEGLRSLGETLIAIAELDQSKLSDQECPADDSYHHHYYAGLDVADRRQYNLHRLTIGRVDEKASGRLRENFPPRKKGVTRTYKGAENIYPVKGGEEDAM
jgi:hypothetical protein